MLDSNAKGALQHIGLFTVPINGGEMREHMASAHPKPQDLTSACAAPE